MHLLTMFRKGLIKVGSRVRCVKTMRTDIDTPGISSASRPYLESIFIDGKIYKVTGIVPNRTLTITCEDTCLSFGNMYYFLFAPAQGMTERYAKIVGRDWKHFVPALPYERSSSL